MKMITLIFVFISFTFVVQGQGKVDTALVKLRIVFIDELISNRGFESHLIKNNCLALCEVIDNFSYSCSKKIVVNVFTNKFTLIRNFSKFRQKVA